jgi:hypothetical protein
MRWIGDNDGLGSSTLLRAVGAGLEWRVRLMVGGVG